MLHNIFSRYQNSVKSLLSVFDSFYTPVSIKEGCLTDTPYKFITLSSSFAVADSIKNDFILNFSLLEMESFPPPEGYILDLSSEGAIVVSRDSMGLFYGVQSLRQLISAQIADSVSFPAATIIDYPDMKLRSAFYGFYLNAMEDDSLIARAESDFQRLSSLKFNMIDLASHHYGHLEMPVPGHSDELLWQRYKRLFELARSYNMNPRVGGWAKWVNTASTWGADLSTLEGIRTTQTIDFSKSMTCTLSTSNGKVAPNVIYDFQSGKTWDKEPVVLARQSDGYVYQEGVDYTMQYAPVHSEPYRKYFETSQTNVEVLFSAVHAGEGEPAGYPLRWGETFNAPSLISLTPDSRISPSEALSLSYSYIGSDPWALHKVRYCRSDQRLRTDASENYIWRWCVEPVKYFEANDFCLDVDETRVFAWDQRCLDSGKSRSQIWADDIEYYYKKIRKYSPQARISLWSDMIDPAHNAGVYDTELIADIIIEKKMDDIVMIPWKAEIAEKSVAFFAEKGFAQMPSCQTLTENGFPTAPIWAHYLRKAYTNDDRSYGLMHCQWGYGFDLADTWRQASVVADNAWSAGPYIIHQPIEKATPGTSLNFLVRIEEDEFVFDGNEVVKGSLGEEVVEIYLKFGSDLIFRRHAAKYMDEAWHWRVGVDGRESYFDYFIVASNGHSVSVAPDTSRRKPYHVVLFEIEKNN